MDDLAPQDIVIGNASDVALAREVAKRLAAKLGFTPTECEEIALALMELSTNLIKHAQGGTIHLETANWIGRTGLQVVAEDRGPGIPDVEQALDDGFSTVGSLGVGLGAVHRLMHDLRILSRDGGGTRVICHRWLRPSTQSEFFSSKLEFGVATRPRRNASANGDAFVVKQWQHQALAAVIDGLGRPLRKLCLSKSALIY